MATGAEAKSINAHTMEVAASPDTIHAGPTYLWGFLVETDKTNDVTVVLSDGATEIITYIVTGTNDSASVVLPRPILFNTSLVVSLAGTASRVVVLWSA